MASKKRRRRNDDTVPLHKPKRVLPHVADEYDELGNHRIAAELRRQRRGHATAYVEAALYEKGANA